MRLRILSEEQKHGFVGDIEGLAEKNSDFRQVLYTGENVQLVLMTLKPGEDIGAETHPDVDQFFRVEEGDGEVIINGEITPIQVGTGIIIPAGSKHNIKNTGEEPLRVYTLYAPPHHADGTVHKTKNAAQADTEEFTGETSE